MRASTFATDNIRHNVKNCSSCPVSGQSKPQAGSFFIISIRSCCRIEGYKLCNPGICGVNKAGAATDPIVLKKSEDDIFVREGAKIESDLHCL